MKLFCFARNSVDLATQYHPINRRLFKWLPRPEVLQRNRLRVALQSLFVVFVHIEHLKKNPSAFGNPKCRMGKKKCQTNITNGPFWASWGKDLAAFLHVLVSLNEIRLGSQTLAAPKAVPASIFATLLPTGAKQLQAATNWSSKISKINAVGSLQIQLVFLGDCLT